AVGASRWPPGSWPALLAAGAPSHRAEHDHAQEPSGVSACNGQNVDRNVAHHAIVEHQAESDEPADDKGPRDTTRDRAGEGPGIHQLRLRPPADPSLLRRPCLSTDG